MLTQLETSQFNKVRHLFSQLESKQPMCTAVLEGVYPGSVYANDPGHPTAALLTTYLVPFEAVSVLLLVVMIGAAYLARQE